MNIIRTPEYQAWADMKRRCRTPSTSNYPIYGGRGISVCERWEHLKNFLDDMGLRPSRKHSLDRINNSGNYEPRNCRWATQSQQSRNKRNAVIVTFAGRSQSATAWAEEIGVKPNTMRKRLKAGMPLDQALFITNVRRLRKKRRS